MKKAAGPGRLAGIALGGIVLGHLIAYRLADPSAASRSSHLARTGHGYFEQALVAALAVAAIALISVGIRAFRNGPVVSASTALRVLIVIQVAGFAFQELSERGFNLASTARD